MRFLIAFFIIPTLIWTNIAIADSPTEPVDVTLREIFDYARKEDVDSLEKMREDIMSSNDRTLMNTYPLALYIASPDKYREEFVGSFPTDYAGLMHDLFRHVESERLTPTFMFSVE